jgi:hypothetical protein
VTEEALAPYRIVEAQDCFAGCVYHYWVGRNTYHGTWSNTYPLESAFHQSKESLRAAVERQRRQGSTFWFGELPAIVLTGSGRSLVLLQPNSWEPFTNYVEQDATDSSIGAIAEAVRKGCKGSEIWEQSPPQSRGEYSYASFKSIPFGANEPLHWSKGGQVYKVNEFKRMIQGINEILRAGA